MQTTEVKWGIDRVGILLRQENQEHLERHRMKAEALSEIWGHWDLLRVGRRRGGAT